MNNLNIINMTNKEFNKLSNYKKLELIGTIPQPGVSSKGINTGAAKFFLYLNGKRHRIYGDSVRFSKADGIRNDHYTIHLGAIVLAVEDGDESLDIKAE